MRQDREEREFDALVEHLRRTRGVDFTAYKRPSLVGRVQKRMHEVGIDTFPDYVEYLDIHPDEFSHLCNGVLINVTSFFRDHVAWEYVRDEVVPPMLAAREGAPIRVWTAGCASGEETYSIAMLLAEALGREQFRDRVTIYATDADEQALSTARGARYAGKQVAGLA